MRQYLDYYDIAQHTGYTLETIRTYAKRSRNRAKTGELRPHDFPAPDVQIGSREQYASPGWEQSTIDEWMRHKKRA